MKLGVASVDCHVEEGLESLCLSWDSPMRIREWQIFGLVWKILRNDLTFLKFSGGAGEAEISSFV